MKDLTKKVLNTYEEKGNIIIGVDFDDTIFPIDPENKLRCDTVVDLLIHLKRSYNITICLFTVADKYGLMYKKELMKYMGIEPDYVNESPVKLWGEGCAKPYFNLYIDDKSGINEIIEVIKELLVERHKKQI